MTESKIARVAGRVRRGLADAESAGSLAAKLRAGRWRRFLDLYPNLEQMQVIDLGGTVAYWEAAPVKPSRVVVVNLFEQQQHPSWVETLIGDVCDLPASILEQHFDLAYSNSVIEHVGGHVQRSRMAEAIRSLADRHWVQTPYRYFPIEPHWLFPGYQFLPTTVEAVIASRWPLAWGRPADRHAAVGAALNVELLDRTQLKFYFPDASLLTERVAGLPKSLIAVR